MGVPLDVDHGLEATVIISSTATQPLEGAGLRVLYLLVRSSCQLAGANTP